MTSTYTAVRHGAIHDVETVIAGDPHGAAWAAANAAWRDARPAPELLS